MTQQLTEFPTNLYCDLILDDSENANRFGKHINLRISFGEKNRKFKLATLDSRTSSKSEESAK